MQLNKPLLSLITDRQILNAPATETNLTNLVNLCLRAAQAGIDIIQIREKDLPTNQLSDLVSTIVNQLNALPNNHTRLVVNDRLDIALCCGANGVHLPSAGLPLASVRKLVKERGLTDFIIGISAHSVAEAQAAAQQGADYILLGPIFDTPSKRAYGAPLGLAVLKETSNLPCPIFALGGIDKDNYTNVLECGAAGLAAIRLFAQEPDLQELIYVLKG